MKKSVPSFVLVLCIVGSVLASAFLTVQICHRYMYLNTRLEYERKLAELSEKLNPPQEKDAYPDLSSKFQAIYDLFRENYIGKTDEKAIETALLKDYMKLTGDRYAEYYTAEERAALNASTSGSSVGIGLTVTCSADGRMMIIYVEKDGPADKAGLRPGEEITAVGSERVADIGYEKALKAMSVGKGKELEITVVKDKNEHTYSLTAGKITVASVHSALEGTTGYIRILTFNNNTFDEFKKALDALISQGAERLIFDLRSNTGGTLDAVHKTVDYLVADKNERGEDRTVVTTVDAFDNRTRYLCADGHTVDLPMAVLTDKKTASAAELFAAALRDHGKATVVGEKTYGKGVAQSVVTLKDGSAVKFTVARYDPPSGVNYDGTGITPDVEASSGGVNIYLIPLSEDPVFAAALAELEEYDQ